MDSPLSGVPRVFALSRVILDSRAENADISRTTESGGVDLRAGSFPWRSFLAIGRSYARETVKQDVVYPDVNQLDRARVGQLFRKKRKKKKRQKIGTRGGTAARRVAPRRRLGEGFRPVGREQKEGG